MKISLILLLVNSVSALKVDFINPELTQLQWDEYNSKEVKDTMEWNDEDFEFTAKHPDWATSDEEK